jgi:hypothetical protein
MLAPRGLAARALWGTRGKVGAGSVAQWTYVGRETVRFRYISGVLPVNLRYISGKLH